MFIYNTNIVCQTGVIFDSCLLVAFERDLAEVSLNPAEEGVGIGSKEFGFGVFCFPFIGVLVFAFWTLGFGFWTFDF